MVVNFHIIEIIEIVIIVIIMLLITFIEYNYSRKMWFIDFGLFNLINFVITKSSSVAKFVDF